jgi:hypothetical protein
MFFIASFMFFPLYNWRMGSAGEEVAVGSGGGWGRGRRMNMVQPKYTYIYKCKNDTCCRLFQESGEGG